MPSIAQEEYAMQCIKLDIFYQSMEKPNLQL